MSLEGRKREQIAEHMPSQTKKYHVLGDEKSGDEAFTYYANKIDAPERSPMWTDLFSELAQVGEGKGKIVGVLSDKREVLATASDVRVPHFYMVEAQSKDAEIKACITIRKGNSEPDSPQTHNARIALGRYDKKPEVDVEEQCAYAEATGDYFYKSLPDRRDTMNLHIEVLVDRFETVFRGPLAQYPEAKPLLGKLSQGEKKE
jgi:hypothetical protein